MPVVDRSIALLVRGNGAFVPHGRRQADQRAWLRVAGLNLRRLLNLGLQENNGTWALA